MKSLPEDFCFAVRSGQFRDLTQATAVENPENREIVETFEEQAWFWDDLEDETECSPCYFDVGNHGQDPSLASYQDKWSYWEGLAGS